MRSGDVDGAMQEFDKALDWLPGFADAVVARAELLDSQGHCEAARGEYERARRLWSEMPAGAPDRRYLFRRRGHFAFEIEAYDLVRSNVRNKILPQLAHGNALLARGRAKGGPGQLRARPEGEAEPARGACLERRGAVGIGPLRGGDPGVRFGARGASRRRRDAERPWHRPHGARAMWPRPTRTGAASSTCCRRRNLPRARLRGDAAGQLRSGLPRASAWPWPRSPPTPTGCSTA